VSPVSAIDARRRDTILIAESSDGNRRLLRWALESAGYRYIREAKDADDLGAALQDRAYALMLVDASIDRLEQLDGASSPLILMTASLCGNVNAQVKALGARACVHRPIYVDELLGAVKRTLANDGGTVAHTTAAAA